MLTTQTLSLGWLVASSAAMAVRETTPSKSCVQFEVPIHVVATNKHYSMPRVDNNIDFVDWSLNFSIWMAPKNNAERILSDVFINHSFRISAQLCVPTQETDKADILQIAVHGNAFDKRYWDVQVKPEEHSYVDAAIAKGYSILTWDRIGTGQSEIPNAYDEVQLTTEIEILAGLTKLAREGRLLGSAIKTDGGAVAEPRPSRIVHVAHSFGAYLTYAFLLKHPELSDAALLSSFLPSGTQLGAVKVVTFEHDYAAGLDPARFGGFGSGYFVPTSLNALQKLYFTKGGFDEELLAYAEEIKGPEAAGLYASDHQIQYATNDRLFGGPVQIIIGEKDFPLCNGYCPGTFSETDIKNNNFHNATALEIKVLDNTAHALALQKSARAGYKLMFDFLSGHGF
ncbi:hypothetical protein GGTG_09307 [Gaeumannomyces tritici R3-111a-1]|uniref:AB hydrolase-1 domain-containing protein n=1 Tax=Gaeumannomyces tritici (strain R3-111a-1) TaxID=644352 RepID=J3P710_GAET3|nr:hypothetical protein GGTG_09307 [Gaeumannomyces tritici R3-111a-1]EJT72441.1 hypothetical protein GGTG_09307 [Gaeumannomyces tritici R3-111a-1]